MVRLAEARWRGSQAGGDAMVRGQALGSSLTEAGTRLSETRWRGGQAGGDAVARGQALGSSLTEAKKKKQYIIYMGEKQVLTRGALLLIKKTTNYLTTQ